MTFIASHRLVRAVMLGLGTGLIGGGAVIPLGKTFSRDVLDAGTGGLRPVAVRAGRRAPRSA